MRLCEVVLDIPTATLDQAYTYSIPDEIDGASVGVVVLVPFGARQCVGFITRVYERDISLAALSAGATDLDPARLKPIMSVLSASHFTELGAACAQFIAERYVAPLSSALKLFTPPGGVGKVVKHGDTWELKAPEVKAVDERVVYRGGAFDEFTPAKNAVKQRAIIDALRVGHIRVSELTAELGSVSAALKTLEAKDVVRLEVQRRFRAGAHAHADFDPKDPLACDDASIPELTDDQIQATGIISDALRASNGQVVLLDGVTGSGKTEVYLRAIEQVLREGRRACVLVPEISLTPQTVARFRARFGDLVAVMHSRMSTGERFDEWEFIRSGIARVVVGARSALFTPIENLGLIIIDEEHEQTYKQDSQPRYVARDVAEWMVQQIHGTLILGSATPSIESLYNQAKRDNWRVALMPHRANGASMPRVRIVDMAREFGGGSRSMFSRDLTHALKRELTLGHKAVMLLNQRGFARFVLCRDCGYVPSCPSCSTSLTFHEVGNKLICHHCGYEMTHPAKCPECGSVYLRKFGAGTQRVEAELKRVLTEIECAHVPVIRMDADTTKTKGAHESLLTEFGAPGASVLLGTQMIAKGLDFDEVTLVGVIDADTQLRLPDFRSAERTFDLIEQVAGRAGRAQLPGEVFIQTYSADNPAILAAARYDRTMFLKDELPKRRQLMYPPYARLADTLIWGKNEAQVRDYAQELFRMIQEHLQYHAPSSWVLYPATPCVLSKVRDAYRYHILLKVPEHVDIGVLLAPVFRTRKVHKYVNVALNIDPASVL